MPREYFKPAQPPKATHGANWRIVRRTRSGKLVRDQLPPEGVYTRKEMDAVVSPVIPGEWIKPRRVGFIFGLRQVLGAE